MRTITLSEDEYVSLLLAIGYATGAASLRGDGGYVGRLFRLANAVNRDNPAWTPYQVPEEPPHA
jgi:hypothetical protein